MLKVGAKQARQSLEKKNEEKKAIEKCKEKQRKPADKFHEQNEMSTVNLPYTLLLSYVLLVVVFFLLVWSHGCLLVFWADYFLF